MKKQLATLIALSIVLTAILEASFYHYTVISNSASAESADINKVFHWLLIAGLPIFSIIISGLVLALIFFRNRGKETRVGYERTSFPRLEAIWTIVPLFVVIGVSIFGGVMLDNMVKVQPNELEINVTASRYLFQFEYPGTGIKSYELVVPVGQRMHFSLTSTDVVHNFWVREWGPKQDCLPGMITDLRITPDKIGNFTVVCSQLCGPGHTYMTAPVRVLSLADYNAWVLQQTSTSTTPPPVTTMPGMGP